MSARYRERADATLFDRYLDRCTGLVVFTAGPERIRYGRKNGRKCSFNPPRIKPLDTSGAGDSFRAGMVYGLLEQWSDAECVRFASALAAMTCLRFPGVLQSPSRAEVQSYLQRL